MKARGFFGTFVILSLITGSIFTIIIVFIESLVLDLSIRHIVMEGFFSRQSVWLGAAFGMAFGYVYATSLKCTIITMPYEDRSSYELQITNLMLLMGYHPINSNTNPIIFRRSQRVLFFAGRIVVLMENGEAAIEGPRAYLGRIRRHFVNVKAFDKTGIILPDFSNPDHVPSEHASKALADAVDDINKN